MKRQKIEGYIQFWSTVSESYQDQAMVGITSIGHSMSCEGKIQTAIESQDVGEARTMCHLWKKIIFSTECLYVL